jgi:hypothetical protein
MMPAEKAAVLGRLDAIVRRHLPLSGNCAVVTFESLQEVFELEDGAVTRALAPFPLGMQGGETCGVVRRPAAIGLALGGWAAGDTGQAPGGARPAKCSSV